MRLGKKLSRRSAAILGPLDSGGTAVGARYHWRSAGFTLIELLLVISIFSIILGVTTINVLRPRADASIDGTVSSLVADLRAQQTKAMAGGKDGGASADSQGVYIQSDSYTLFKGSAYSSMDPDNFVVMTNGGVTLSNNLASDQVVFAQVSGEFSGYALGSDTITVSNNAGDTQQIVINRYGTVIIVE